jgi:glycerol kinase
MVAECGGDADHFRPLVGLPVSTYFSGLKLKWLLEEVPAVRQAVKKGTALFGTIDSWLIWNLTGGVKGGRHLTSVCNASRTFLMNINTRKWEPKLLKRLGVPSSMLPEIRSNSEVYGRVEGGALAGVALAGCLGDQQAALLGQQCFAKGQAKNTYGTGCFMLLNTGSTAVQSTHGLLTTVGFQLGPSAPCLYALEGSIAVAGVGVKWLQENLGLIDKSTDMDGLVASIPNNEGVYMVPAFSGLLSPYWRSDARGVITGLTLQSTKAHLTRAVLEATAYQTRDVLEAMVKDTQITAASSTDDVFTLAELYVDGGMTNSDFLMQFQADQLGISVARPAMQECTAAGAAFAAGLAVGFWTSPAHIATSVTGIAFTTFYPAAPSAEVERDYRGWRRALTKSLDLAEEAPPVRDLPAPAPTSLKGSPGSLSASL